MAKIHLAIIFLRFFGLHLQGSQSSEPLQGDMNQLADLWSLSTQNLHGPSTTNHSAHHMKLFNPITTHFYEFHWCGLTVGKT